MSSRLWLLVIFACVGAFAPSRADARTAETCAQGFLDTATAARQESEPQVAGLHRGSVTGGYELASGYSQAAENGSALLDASEAAFKAADSAEDFTVSAKHLADAGGGWAIFAEGTDPNALIEEALRSENAVFSPNNVDGAIRVTTDLGREIGRGVGPRIK